MKFLLAVMVLAVAPLSAQNGPPSYSSTPEQFPGQLTRLRLELSYPKLVTETTRPTADDPEGRLSAFLAESEPVLKNIERLTAYLHDGLRDPRAAEGSRGWVEAWERLDEEDARLRLIVLGGEAFLGAPVPSQSRFGPSKEGFRRLEDKPEFDSPEGLLLHRSLVFAAYTENLREYLIRKSLEASAGRVRETERGALP